MHIRQLIVTGFHSLKKNLILFNPGVNVIVGRNNAGKSNVIRALDYLLGEKWPTSRRVEEKTFYKSRDGAEDADSFTIAAVLGGGGLDRDSLAGLKNVGVHRNCDIPDLRDISAWLENVEETTKAEWISYLDLADYLNEASRVVIYLHARRGSSRGERLFGLAYQVGGSWNLVPRFKAELRDALLTTAYVPSFRDPSYQLRVNQYSWFGKLVKHLYDQRTPEQEQRIKEAQADLANEVQGAFTDVTDSVRLQLKKAVFHHGISFKPGAFTKDDDYKSITLFVDDGIDAPFYEKGSGIQSALVLALFAAYCQSFHSGSSLLMVEEPELYLHPQARRAIEAQLQQFILDGIASSGERQIIISTHSPEFLRSVTPERLVVVRKLPGETVTTVSQLPPDVEESVRNRQITRTRSAEMFFADHVIMVEGGEEHIVHAIADLMYNRRSFLDTANISVARVDGKGQFRGYTDLLDSFGIGWTIITDLDFLKDGASSYSEYLGEKELDALSRVVSYWKAIKELPRRNRVFKERVFDPECRDWKELYLAVEDLVDRLEDGFLPGDNEVSRIRDLWDCLSDRVHSANYDELRSEEKNRDDLNRVIEQLRLHGIFVLPEGDLETYLTASAMELDRSKDRRAILVGEKLSECSDMQEATKWIEPSGFTSALRHAVRRLREFNNDIDDSATGEAHTDAGVFAIEVE